MPTDYDMNIDFNINDIDFIEKNEPKAIDETLFSIEDAKELAMEKGENGRRTGIMQKLHEIFTRTKKMIKNSFEKGKDKENGEDTDDKGSRGV